LFLLIASLLFAPESSAPQTLSPGALRVSGTQGCEPRADIHERLAEHLGPEWGASLSHTTIIDVRIERDRGTFTAHIRATIEGDVLQRSLQSPRCEVLVAATALVLAVAAEPVITAAKLEASHARSEPAILEASELVRESRTNDAVQPGPPASPRPPPRTGPPAHWLRVAVGPAAAPFPSAGVAVGLRYLAAWRFLGLGAELGYQVPQAFLYADGQGTTMQAASLSVIGCPGLYGTKGHISGCTGVRASLIPTRPRAVPAPERPVLGWAGALVGVDVAFAPVPRIEIGASAEGVLSCVRPAVHVSGRDLVYRAPLLGWQALFGVALRLR